MKIIATLFAIGLMAECNAALAAEAGDASGADLSNPFRIVGPDGTHVPDGIHIIVSGEDVSSPFNEAHPIEQGFYESLYYSHYHGHFYDVNAPAPQELPSAFDAKDDRYGLMDLLAGLHCNHL